MSSTSTSQQAKSRALEQLRFNKQAKANASSSSSSSSMTTVDPRQPRYPAPPTQSRDATVNSRFFVPGPNVGKILVPNSSPEPPEPPRNGHYGTQYSSAMPAIPGQSAPYAPEWARGPRPFGSADPLAASTSFTSSLNSIPSSTTSSSTGTSKRPWNGSDSNNHYGEQPPPLKKLRGPSMESQQDVIEIPSSPEAQRAGGGTRHVPSKASLDSSMSEDDVLPSIIGGTSKSRLVRERPTPTPPAPSLTSTPSADDGYKFFKITHPMDSDERCRAAWNATGGDKVKADALVSNPAWSPPRPRPVSTGVAVVKKEIVGRVEEMDEINKQQRAAVKEKGKKSMIYANRPVLDTSTVATPPVSRVAPAVAATPQSPETPFVPTRAPKRRNKLVESSDEESEEEAPREAKKSRSEMTFEGRTLQYFNTRNSAAIQELTGCTADQAESIISKRPFASQDDFTEKVCTKKKSAGGISPKVFDDVVKIFKGYGSVDSILEDCEQIGASLRSAFAAWTTPDGKASSSSSTLPEDEVEDGALAFHTLDGITEKRPKNFLTKQPAMLPEGVMLKDYQLLGVNWLNLLYSRKYSCILADEMGLGKTIQVISFLAHLKERGNIGPHLVVVPSSTLENWCREFARFAPDIKVQTYYGGKNDRPMLRATLLETSCDVKSNGWEVLITTYQLAVNDSLDRKFFKKVEWNCAIFDEGHVLKNFQSSRYQYLVTYAAKWKLLLTGTPLQNNLQELVSLMNFILPDQFDGQFSDLQEIFKAKGDANVSLLSQERISRAKKMMTPFVLRRKKAQVLKDLPNKTERIEWCELTDLQQSIYNDALERSRKTIMDAELGSEPATGTSTPVTSKPVPAAAKKKTRPKDKQYAENSSNVLMDLRKAASHPMLFRTLYTDADLNGMTKQLLKEPDFKKRGAVFEFVKEDMTVMTDAELQLFCKTYKCLRRFSKDDDSYLNAGKVKTLLKLITQYREEDRKILIFSQFTQILDILQAVLKSHKIKYLLLTGSTPVDVRQSLVDEFTEDESIPVFLLSTKAGGMGINLTAASVVIMFDQDFNPHNDKQAQDRAYRIGQKRDVDVVKLISRNTIEEAMLKLGVTKLALDEAVAGDVDADGEAKGESKAEKEVKTSLMKVLRRQLEDKEEGKGKEVEGVEDQGDSETKKSLKKVDAPSPVKESWRKDSETKRPSRLKTERSRA